MVVRARERRERNNRSPINQAFQVLSLREERVADVGTLGHDAHVVRIRPRERLLAHARGEALASQSARRPRVKKNDALEAVQLVGDIHFVAGLAVLVGAGRADRLEARNKPPRPPPFRGDVIYLQSRRHAPLRHVRRRECRRAKSSREKCEIRLGRRMFVSFASWARRVLPAHCRAR